MIIPVHYTMDDIKAYYLFSYRHPKNKKKINLQILKNISIYGFALGLIIYLIQRDLYYSIGFGIFAGIVALIRNRFDWKRSALRWAEDNKKEFNDHQLTIEPKGLIFKGSDYETLLHWAAITAIEETEDHYFFNYKEEGFYPLPKSIFPTADDSKQFSESVKAFQSGDASPTTWWTQSGVTEAENVQKAGRT